MTSVRYATVAGYMWRAVTDMPRTVSVSKRPAVTVRSTYQVQFLYPDNEWVVILTCVDSMRARIERDRLKREKEKILGHETSWRVVMCTVLDI